jgi:hypothetical protein
MSADTARETSADTAPKTPADPAPIEVIAPIERVVYRTDDYRAVVEGFRPALVELELYPQSTLITRETTLSVPSRRWSIGLQAGYGITANGPAPYLGIGVQYRIFLK